MKEITKNDITLDKEVAAPHKSRNRPINVLYWIVFVLFSLLVLIYTAEHILRANDADHFFTLAAVPVGVYQQPKAYQEIFGNDETYAMAKNYRGEEIFKNPNAAFLKTEKECSPLLEDMKKEGHLPAFSIVTYRKYLDMFGQPPAYPNHDETQVMKVYQTCKIYLTSTQLLFAPKTLMDGLR